MKFTFVKQKKLIDSYKESLVAKGVIGEFIARRNANNNWEIEYRRTYSPNTKSEYCYIEKLERKRGKAREFARLNGVEKFMELVGVQKFTVIM